MLARWNNGQPGLEALADTRKRTAQMTLRTGQIRLLVEAEGNGFSRRTVTLTLQAHSDSGHTHGRPAHGIVLPIRGARNIIRQTFPGGVTVAQQVLVLFVHVRIMAGEIK
jgi:hypothetical protein